MALMWSLRPQWKKVSLVSWRWAVIELCNTDWKTDGHKLSPIPYLANDPLWSCDEMWSLYWGSGIAKKVSECHWINSGFLFQGQEEDINRTVLNTESHIHKTLSFTNTVLQSCLCGEGIRLVLVWGGKTSGTTEITHFSGWLALHQKVCLTVRSLVLHHPCFLHVRSLT